MTLRYEKQKVRQGYKYIIGVDEVGRGSLAGPVVAAAVILDLRLGIKDLRGVKDSKLLSAAKRERLFQVIVGRARAWAVGQVESEVIDQINIHQATLLAMSRAVEKLQRFFWPERALVAVDGPFKISKVDLPQEAVIDGDNKILSVAAASILAKVYRDNLMRELDQIYPSYNFGRHKGYGTLQHRQMILRRGICQAHRLSFCRNLQFYKCAAAHL